MSPRAFKRFWAFGAYILAVASLVATHALREFTLAETLAVAAFIFGLALWQLAQATDGLIITGVIFGLGGVLLKGLFVLLGVGADHHDMTTHETTPGNPLLVHIHHLFFNIGFLCYFGALARAVVTTLQKKASDQGKPT